MGAKNIMMNRGHPESRTQGCPLLSLHYSTFRTLLTALSCQRGPPCSPSQCSVLPRPHLVSPRFFQGSLLTPPSSIVDQLPRQPSFLWHPNLCAHEIPYSQRWLPLTTVVTTDCQLHRIYNHRGHKPLSVYARGFLGRRKDTC